MLPSNSDRERRQDRDGKVNRKEIKKVPNLGFKEEKKKKNTD